MFLRSAGRVSARSGRCLSADSASVPPPSSPSPSPPPLTADVLTPERHQAFVERLSNVRLPGRIAQGTPTAAVLAPLCRVDGQPGLLYTLRSSALNKHAGEVAFPGGNCDRGDADPLATALRETEEEIGLRVDRERPWAALPQMLSGFKSKPVAAFAVDVGDLRLETLRPQPDEVEDVFFLSLEHLCRSENAGHTQFRRGDAGYSLPMFLNGPHRVWGLTAVFTHMLMSSLLPEWYRHTVPYVKPLRDGES